MNTILADEYLSGRVFTQSSSSSMNMFHLSSDLIIFMITYFEYQCTVFTPTFVFPRKRKGVSEESDDAIISSTVKHPCLAPRASLYNDTTSTISSSTVKCVLPSMHDPYSATALVLNRIQMEHVQTHHMTCKHVFTFIAVLIWLYVFDVFFATVCVPILFVVKTRSGGRSGRSGGSISRPQYASTSAGGCRIPVSMFDGSIIAWYH